MYQLTLFIKHLKNHTDGQSAVHEHKNKIKQIKQDRSLLLTGIIAYEECEASHRGFFKNLL